MCIIVAKPTGVELPLEDIFDNCFVSNRDGIGFAFNKPGEKVVICKGFQNVKNMIKMFDTFNITKEHNLLVHFRLATHGKKDEGNCHPFPLTNDFGDMRFLHCACDTAIAHNGVFGGMKQSNTNSDTMKFISTVLASPEIISNLESKSVKELIRGYCGYSSKLAFLRVAGMTTIGDFEEDKGIFYSNSQYKSWSNRSNAHYNTQTRDMEYCLEHQIWDRCKKEKGGQEYCYLHKKWDDCEWCDVHRKLDNCAKSSKILNLTVITCESCGTKDDVLFDQDLKANMCPSCKTLYVGGYGD